MQNETNVEMKERILNMRGYFSLDDSPEDLLKEDPSLARRAIALLDRIKKLSGVEYTFVHIQEGPFGGYCAPKPKDYTPENQNVTHLLGSYDKEYFVDFLEKKST